MCTRSQATISCVALFGALEGLFFCRYFSFPLIRRLPALWGVQELHFQDLAGFSIGRDPDSHAVDLAVYLSYAGVTKPLPLAAAFLTGMHTHGDNTFYVGLVTIALAGFTLMKCRSAEGCPYGIWPLLRFLSAPPPPSCSPFPAFQIRAWLPIYLSLCSFLH